MTDHDLLRADRNLLEDHDLLIRLDVRLDNVENKQAEQCTATNQRFEKIEESLRWPLRTVANALITAVVAIVVSLAVAHAYRTPSRDSINGATNGRQSTSSVRTEMQRR
jgi:hypothetical protein